MHTQIFRLRRKSHSLLDDPRITVCDSIYRAQSAELKHDPPFAILPTESNLPR